jgi:hypothetical protein
MLWLDQRILYACWENTCYNDQKNWRETSAILDGFVPIMGLFRLMTELNKVTG